MTVQSEKTTKQRQDTVEKLLEQFRPFLLKAINDGVRIGMEETRRTLASALMDGALPSNDGVRRRDKTTKHAIHCPVKDCERAGIKPLNNFCQHHFESLPKERRVKLRAEQLERRKTEAAKASERVKKAAAETMSDTKASAA
jgi:hypothetical protein